MRKIFPSLLLLLSMGISAFAQQRQCYTEEHNQELLANDPKYAIELEKVEEQTRAFIANNDLTAMAVNGVVTIPTVFHILHNGDAVGSGENIADQYIIAQLNQMNLDFSATNPDVSSVPSEFAGDVADLEIQFCLATQDPNGNATSGILRYNTGSSSLTRNQLEGTWKPQTIWDRNSYLNFWSVRFGGGDSGLLGYAQFPGGSSNTDGVVCVYSSIGSVANPNPAGSPYNLGRTGTHEVGHWLNLRHIWGDGGCTVDDFVSDTPLQGQSYGGRPTYPQSTCGSNDMFMNYMDYVYDDAMFMFSNGQKTRARALFDGSRASLLNSNGCGQGTAPTCSDGVQNGQETGVDCGGPDCAPCSTGCSDNEVTLTITLDNYPEETSWSVRNDAGQTVASGGTYGSQPDGTTISETLCLVDDCYTFTINDSYGDGICCSYGQGSYSLTSGGTTLASGGAFGSSESTDFCLGAPSGPTCSDGIQNGNETGVDCGGPDCAPCAPTCDDGIQNGQETGVDCGGPDCAACPPTCDDGIQNGDETGVDCGGSQCAPCSTGGADILHEGYFESGLDGWVDGGSDCARVSSSRSYEGSYSVRLRDNTNSSTMTLNNLNTTGYNQVEINFYFYPNSMENGEDFWVQFRQQGSSSWATVASYASGSSFTNGSFYTATVVLDAGSYNFGSSTDFRFRCDASANADQIYIDQVTITGVNGGARRGNSIERLGDGPAQDRIQSIGDEVDEVRLSVYPNPANGFVNVNVLGADELRGYRIVSLYGQVVQAGELKTGQQLDVSQLASGAYILLVETEEGLKTTKFIKQ